MQGTRFAIPQAGLLHLMESRNRRVWGDRLASACAFGLVLLVIVSFDTRVREQIETRAATTATVRGTAARINEAGSVLWDAARTQSIEHAPMTIFVVAAGLLLLCMMRE